ncbi:MAG: NAD(P)H-dependent oxidoreductase [Synechococcales bacterium]|nr:NAD(P)H-dependent oxidoreductase [Synechococcales bacterium]
MAELFIPVILGTNRKGCMSRFVANFVVEQVQAWASVDTELIDIGTLPIPTDDAGLSIKDPGFSATVERADGLIIVVPEYNHAYPGLLKHVLDTNLKEYIHKAVGLCGVSAGAFGGTRVIQSMLPVMRELGLVTTFYDLNFSGVNQLFDEQGAIADRETYVRRFDRFMKELVWMSAVLQHGRQAVSLDPEKDQDTLVFHANKPCPEEVARLGSDATDAAMEVKTCSETGRVEATLIR